MNKIILENEKVIETSLDNIEYKFDEKKDIFDISCLSLIVNKDSDLNIHINMNEESKLIINITISDNITLNLNVITEGNIGKIQYKYNLGKSSCCILEKYNYIDTIREMIVVNLDESSKFNYNFKSIATNKENYDYMIYHNGKNSVSDIKNNIVSEIGDVYLQVSSFIPKEIIGCSTNQFNRIINLSNNKCEIRPILYIDCDDVEANHSALIDKFRDEEIFYLESKGIDYENAIKLLIKGFLLNGINNKEIIDLIIKRYGGE